MSKKFLPYQIIQKQNSIADAMVKQFTSHDEVINYDIAKALGINVVRHTDNLRYRKIWNYMKYWLGGLLSSESTTHIFEYATPKEEKKKPSKKKGSKKKRGGRNDK